MRGLRTEARFHPSQGARYVWNRRELMEASQDPSVTHLMGNEPRPPSFLPWPPRSSESQADTQMFRPRILPTPQPVTTGPLSPRPL